MSPSQQDPPLLLLDGASLWFRAFHGLPTSLTGPDGRPVNAIRGFTDMVASLVRREHPGRLVVCLDEAWRPAWRVAAVPSYKAHRVVPGSENTADATTAGGAADPGSVEETPDQLAHQVPVIRALLDAVGIATAGAPDMEADDVLATLSATETRDRVVVVSGDRDLLQVVADEPVAVRVLYVGRGLARAEMFGPIEVAQRYGVPGDRAGAAYAELALLRGDPSDGLPGVAGIGAKTASRLLLEHGSLAALRAAVDGPGPVGGALTASVRRKLQEASAYLDEAAAVVATVPDADVHLSGDDVLPTVPAHPEDVRAVVERWGVASSVQRLVGAIGEHR